MHYANGHTYRNKTHYELHQLLCDEAEKRDDRGFDAWVLAEREAMCDAVNKYRARLGKNPITIEDVARVEQMAVGHTDYGTKYALYCTELVEETA